MYKRTDGVDDVGIDGKGLRPEGLARRRFEAVPSALERTRTFEGRSRDQEIRGSRLKGRHQRKEGVGGVVKEKGSSKVAYGRQRKREREE